MIILGRCQGTEIDETVYQEIAQLLSEQLPELKIGTLTSESDTPSQYGWRATLNDYIKVNHLADALWNTYRWVLQTHVAVADKIQLVFKLQDTDGNFVQVEFADPRSDKSIYMHCFQENMATTFGRA